MLKVLIIVLSFFSLVIASDVLNFKDYQEYTILEKEYMKNELSTQDQTIQDQQEIIDSLTQEQTIQEQKYLIDSLSSLGY